MSILNQLTSSKTVEGTKTDDDGNAVDNVTSQKTYTYDANGNQTKEADSATGTDISSAYDVENRLSSLTKTVSGTTKLTQTDRYDGEGKRIEKSETDASGNKNTTGYYYQNGSVLSTDTTKDNSTSQSSFNLLGDESNVICSERSNGSYYFYNKDLQGSTTNVIGTDSSGSAVSEVSYVYGDFGETTVNNSSSYNTSSGSDFYNEICYTGGIYDQSTGLYYLNARYYDPEDAGFTTQDTYRGDVNDPDTLNFYSYCAGDPINLIDPSGHDAIVLRSSLASVGHIGLLVQKNRRSGKWIYFSYDNKAWKNKKIGVNVTKFVVGKKVKKGLNKYVGRKNINSGVGARYKESLYISGDFSNSYNYIMSQKNKRKPEYGKYSYTSYNCSWMAVYVLSKGKTKYASKLKEKLYVHNYKEGITAIRTHIPNTIFSELENMCKTDAKSIPN